MKKDFKKITKEINERLIEGKVFLKEEIVQILKDVGLPINRTFVQVFYKEFFTIRSYRPIKFEIKYKEPIYFKHLENLYNTYSQAVNRYNKNYRDKQRTAQLTDELPLSEIDRAISLLKNNGYKVFKTELIEI